MKRILLLLALLSVTFINAQINNFHDTQGKLEVSSSGQANFTIPLQLPPCINDFKPEIDLAYSSSQTDGIAGQGWDVKNISVISRVGSRIDIDGVKDGVNIKRNNKLALDGQRLLLKTGTYWNPNSTYETEVHSNLKIELKNSGASLYFIVIYPDGSRSWYGNYNGLDGIDADYNYSYSQNPANFYMVRHEDAYGNFITYHYAKNAYQINLSEIRFSANGSTTPLNKIVFTYNDTLRYDSYVSGEIKMHYKILDKVEIFTNDSLFKKYQISYNQDGYGYSRASKIQEFNGSNEPTNPIIFEYNTSESGATEVENQYTDYLNVSSSPDMIGDFDGDNRIDFIQGSKLYTKLFQGGGSLFNMPFLVNSNKYFTATTVANGKLNQKRSIVFADEKLDNVEFKVYNLENNGVVNSYNKVVPMDNSGTCEDLCTELEYDDDGNVLTGPGYLVSQCTSPTFVKNSNRYLEGDFNGDGLSDVIVLSYAQTKTYKPSQIDPNVEIQENQLIPDTGGCRWYGTTSSMVQNARLIDLNPTSSTADNSKGNLQLSTTYLSYFNNDPRYIMDFDADGKDDILIISPNKYYRILSFKELPNAPWMELEVIGSGLFDAYSPTKQILFGNFTADNAPDIMIPEADGNGCAGCTTWHIYENKINGNLEYNAFAKITFSTVEYRPFTGGDYETQYHYSNYYALDVNKDGLSDIVRVWRNEYQPHPVTDHKDIDTQWTVEAYVNKRTASGSYSFISEYSSPWNHDSDDNSLAIPLVSSYQYGGLDSDMLMFRYHGNGSFDKTITYIDFLKDAKKDNLLKKVTQSGGAIVDEIEYKSMEFNASDDFYTIDGNIQYPMVELNQKNNRIVSKITNTSLGLSKIKDFKYYSFIVDLNAQGVLGFKKIAQTDWYKSGTKKIWNVTETNPFQRGATVKTYSQLLNGSVFSFTNNSTGLIDKTEFLYTDTLDPNSKKYTLRLNKQTTTNYLTNVINEKVYNTYDPNYFLPTSVTENNYLGTTLQGSTTTTTVYDYNTSGVGIGYYIGRPNEIATNTTIYANALNGTDSKTSNVKHIYTNGNLTHRIENKSNGSAETLVETLDYFSNGLLQKKTISATGTTAANALSPRSTSFTYDSTNRFIKTITDAELLVTTNNSFHSLYGMVLSQTNSNNQTITNEYDNWGKQTKVTDFLGVSLNYAYSRSGNTCITTQTKTNSSGSEGSSLILEQNILGQETRKGVKDIGGNLSYIATEYDALGRKTKQSEPYLSSASQWNTYEYDDYSRLVKTNEYTGKVINTGFTGLTVTTSDSFLTKVQSINANGHVVSSADTPQNGTPSTITYKYDATGNMLESNYNGAKVTMTYDNWGRKSSLIDSSAGTYGYTYNAYGETLTESTPKGITSYDIDPLSGRVSKKTVSGATPADLTSIISTYNYDSSKLLTSIVVQNANDGDSNYAFTYYPTTNLLKKVVETLPTTYQTTFTKELTYDGFGRIDTETSSASAYGKNTSKTIQHTYKNGSEWQLLDGTSELWKANSVNARGQITSATLGNGIAITNTYDSYGYVSQNKHDKGTTNVMTLNNVFEPIRGNLENRYNSMFDAREDFTYDNLDRLISWDGNGQNLIVLPFNTTTDGFTFSGTSTNGSVSNSAGTLKVNLRGFSTAAKKELPLNPTSGNKLRIKADVTGKTGTTGVIVGAVMVETDPDNTLNYVEIPFGTINNGMFDAIYTVSDYFPNPKLTLKFVIDENTPETYNGGGLVTPSTTFYIDNLKVDDVSIKTQNYDDRGRITQNNLGTYNYSISAKPYQASAIGLSQEAYTYYASHPLQNISYNAFKAPIQIEEQGIEKVSFGYNAMQQRSVMYYGSTDTNVANRPYRKYYSSDGSIEVKYTVATNNVEFITYIGGDAYTAPIVLKSDGTAQNYFYLHRDYQGSIVAVTSAIGTVVEKRLFDPWGTIVKVENGFGSKLTKLTFFDRGYTGHEHLQSVGLIHMNGRLYDPKLHRFLEPDNFIQDPTNPQNYNRYGYVLNNPLKYIDPSGEEYDPSGEYGGMTDAQQAGLGGLIASIGSMWGNSDFKEWRGKNLNIENMGNWCGKQLSSINNWLDKQSISMGKLLGFDGFRFQGLGSNYFQRSNASLSSNMLNLNQDYNKAFAIGNNVLNQTQYNGEGRNILRPNRNNPITRRLKNERNVMNYVKQNVKGGFYGAPLRFTSFNGTQNAYFAGAINTSYMRFYNYAKGGLDTRAGRLLMHEYGHYLQNLYSGSLWYNSAVVPSSGMSQLFNPDEHDYNWTEIQANTMAYYFFGKPSFWKLKEYPIDESYISDEFKYQLYNLYRLYNH